MLGLPGCRAAPWSSADAQSKRLACAQQPGLHFPSFANLQSLSEHAPLSVVRRCTAGSSSSHQHALSNAGCGCKCKLDTPALGPHIWHHPSCWGNSTRLHWTQPTMEHSCTRLSTAIQDRAWLCRPGTACWGRSGRPWPPACRAWLRPSRPMRKQDQPLEVRWPRRSWPRCCSATGPLDGVEGLGWGVVGRSSRIRASGQVEKV